MTATVLTRLRALTDGLGVMHPATDTVPAYLDTLAGTVALDPNRLWLAQAAIAAVLPTTLEYERFRRRATLAGTRTALDEQVALASRLRAPNRAVQVRIETGAVVVDVHHTSRTGLATGIQRVVRQTILRWHSRPGVRLVGWDRGLTGLRRLTDAEEQNALYGSVPGLGRAAKWVMTIPYQSTYILPELAIEDDRTGRLSCLAAFSGNVTGVIGFDCVPLTSSETVGAGMSAAFAKNLAALAHFDRLCAISEAAATEYRGWRQMLSGAGIAGPGIEPLLLPSVAESVTDDEFAEARARLVTTTWPLVLVVGSHEPRKNHLAVLYAAERLWADGERFELVFIGGNGWNGDEFAARLKQLQAADRPVRSISAISDSLLWSAYRLARFTVFPSLNEGFGLPVGESLSAGTPVVTSDFGSMVEIAAGGGAVFVDPRDDDELYRGIRSLLRDDELLERLTVETASLPARGWDAYADELWRYLVDGETALPDAAPAGSLPAGTA